MECCVLDTNESTFRTGQKTYGVEVKLMHVYVSALIISILDVELVHLFVDARDKNIWQNTSNVASSLCELRNHFHCYKTPSLTQTIPAYVPPLKITSIPFYTHSDIQTYFVI